MRAIFTILNYNIRREKFRKIVKRILSLKGFLFSGNFLDVF